jgi:CDGSH-type Zn-finger protein
MAEIIIKSKRNSSNLIIVDGIVKADLCRCGKSKAMPLCDDTHRTCGFEAQESEIRIEAKQ